VIGAVIGNGPLEESVPLKTVLRSVLLLGVIEASVEPTVEVLPEVGIPFG
jgi:hypothetical protein